MPKTNKDKDYLDKLRSLVVYHQGLYHTKDAPLISDQAYDALVRELTELEIELEGTTSPVSQAVGATTNNAFTKVRHKVAQWSFDNVFDWAELSAWEKKLERHLAKEGVALGQAAYVAEHKIDGLKLVMEYQAGVLVRAATRGDGEVGEDVTHTALTIKTLPKKLKEPIDLICVGEVWLSQADFQVLNQAELAKGQTAFANPRNAAAGTLRQLDPEVAKNRNLSLFVYDIDYFDKNNSKVADPTTQFEELTLLLKLGFPVNDHSKLCTSLAEVESFYQHWKNKTDKLQYGVDGVVIKLNEVAIQKVAGYTAKSPRFGIAYKFPAVETTTLVEAIDLQVGRTGVITPVAHLAAVKVDGSTVTRATLHNEDQIARLDVRVGDTVIIRKAGDVIPEVVSVVLPLRPDGTKPYRFPKRVMLCGGDGSIERVPGMAAYRCVYLDSDFLRRQKMYYFVSKNALNIDGVGPKIIDALLDNLLISDVADLFTLTSEDLLVLPGFKVKAAENVIRAVAAVRTTTMARFITGLAIEHVGEETARLLAKHFTDFKKFQTASEAELVSIDGVGEVVAASILAWQNNPHDQDLVQRLLGYISFNDDQLTVGSKLAGQTFVFTGTLPNLGRTEAQELARANGALVGSAVSKKTSYLVAGVEAGTKLEEANRLQVPVLSEAEFLALIA